MTKHFGQFRSIQLLCPNCAGVLVGTGRVINEKHIFRCTLCKGAYRWVSPVWRPMPEFVAAEENLPLERREEL